MTFNTAAEEGVVFASDNPSDTILFRIHSDYGMETVRRRVENGSLGDSPISLQPRIPFK